MFSAGAEGVGTTVEMRRGWTGRRNGSDNFVKKHPNLAGSNLRCPLSRTTLHKRLTDFCLLVL